jgi:hypothetical protein
MNRPWGEDLWNLMTMFNGIGYTALFVLAVIWARLLLSVIEGALTSGKRHVHRFGHPLITNPSKDTRPGSHDHPHVEDSSPQRPSVGLKGRGRKYVRTRKARGSSLPCGMQLTTAHTRRILDTSPL